MELPQSRPQGGKATHDFLSLYASSPDPAPPPQGGFVKTHDFLQPLELVGTTTMTKKEGRISGVSGGGTYFDNRVVSNPERNLLAAARPPSAMPKNSDNSVTSFTLWDESVAVKENAGKENVAATLGKGVDVAGGQWRSLFQKTSHLSSIQKNTIAATTFSSQPLPSSKKKQSFMDMIISAKNDREEDEMENEDDGDEEMSMKKEISSSSHSQSQPRGNLVVKVEANLLDQKSPNTPRSKHSATEQRRRSKINDRFQKLREIIPNSEQKRDKASFLLEVIDYIQFLQEKVNRFEGPYNNDIVMMPPPPPTWMRDDDDHNDHVGFLDHNTTESITKFDEKEAIATPINGQRSHTTTIAATALREKDKQHMIGHSSQIQQKGSSSCQPSPDGKTVAAIDNGTISISSSYSQGLLNAITQALQRSGVDLSQASISVKLDLGNRQNGHSSTSTANKERDATTTSVGEEDMGLAMKRQRKTS